MPRPLKIAVTPWSFSQTGHASELVAQAKIAESLGFHSFWLPENHFGDARAIPSPLTLLAAVAASTQYMLLGTTSYLLPIRNPLQAAEEVAVVDRLSGGRLILGVGRGTNPAMFDAFAVPAKQKRQLFERHLDIMRRAWQGEPILMGAEPPIRLAPLPVQQPHPPIWIAAFGPLALKQAGTLGLPYLASPIETLDTLQQNYARHQRFVEASGFAPLDTIPVMRTIFITESAAVRREVTQAVEAMAPHSMQTPNASIDDWALIGSAAYVRERLAAYQDILGLTHVIARGRIEGISSTEWLKSLERLAEFAH
ncbi:MAG: alkanesulfonate monooxygenase SsuD [Candidatus Pseudothioglobus sp.]|jgi:alkanesulfonate monooxygenase SsuD/methylene tetrahydromethanopterin reductase-like flavin-dependent oxidoreductase (luciferase family)